MAESQVSKDELLRIEQVFAKEGIKARFSQPSVRRIIDGNQIRHTLNGHGDPKTEAARGNIAVTLDDIAKYPEIVKDHDFKIYSRTKRYNLPAIVYGKQINGYAIIVEEVRTGRGNIAFFDMYKHRGTLTKDSLRLMKDRALATSETKLPRENGNALLSAQDATIAKSGAKVKEGKTLKSYAPYVAPPIAALFGLDDDLGDNSRPISLDLVIGQSNRFRDYRAEWQEGSGQTRKERARPLHRKRLLWE